MNSMLISSRDNPRIKKVAKLLSSANARKESGLFVAEGMRLCSDVLQSGIEIQSVFYTKQASERYGEKLADVVKAAKESFLVEEKVFEKMGDTATPQGVLALCRIPDCGAKFSANNMYIAMERVGDPSNLGAVARSAEAFGIDGIFLGGGGVDPFSPKALRASMGALVRLPVFVCPDFCTDMEQLKKQGARIVGTVVREGKSLVQFSFKKGDIVVIGNEADGLSDSAADVCDERVTIPMSGRAESLNAATAATVFIWEMTKGGSND